MRQCHCEPQKELTLHIVHLENMTEDNSRLTWKGWISEPVTGLFYQPPLIMLPVTAYLCVKMPCSCVFPFGVNPFRRSSVAWIRLPGELFISVEDADLTRNCQVSLLNCGVSVIPRHIHDPHIRLLSASLLEISADEDKMFLVGHLHLATRKSSSLWWQRVNATRVADAAISLFP